MPSRLIQIIALAVALTCPEVLVSAQAVQPSAFNSVKSSTGEQNPEKQSADLQSPEKQSAEIQTPDLSRLLAIENPEERVRALREFLEKNADSPQSDAVREFLVQSLAVVAEGQLTAQNIEQAVENFRQALKSAPVEITDKFFESTLIRIPLAVAVRGYRNEAVLLARDLEAHCASSSVRLGAIGEFYLSLEAAEDAKRTLETAVRLKEDDARIHRTLGAAYRMSLRPEEAIKSYQQAIAIDPNDKRAYYELANMQRSNGAYEEAIRLYKRQIEIDPAHTASHKGLALAYLSQGKSDKAEAALNGISAEDLSQDYYLQTQMALCYLIHGQTMQARQSVERALRTEPRFTWARIAAAEVDLAENRLFDSEKHLLTAMQYGNFPTLHFTLGKVYLTAEDYDGALTQFARAFKYNAAEGFQTRLGGITDVTAEKLSDLLMREQQAALYLFEPLTTWAQFRTAETLVRLDKALHTTLSDKLPEKVGAAKKEQGREEKKRPELSAEDAENVEKAATEFVEAEPVRVPFRALYVAQRLAQSGQYPGIAVKYSQQALAQAESATKEQGALRDYPNYDQDGRLRIFRGRAADAQGWALFKAGKSAEAIDSLTAAVKYYGDLPEATRAKWHLATAKESVGALRESLDLYLAAYEPPAAGNDSKDLNRKMIESLYQRVYGSLKGFNERLGKTIQTAESALPSATASLPVENTKSYAVKPDLPVNNRKESVAEAPAAVSSSGSEENKTDVAVTETGRQPQPLFGKPAFVITLPKPDAEPAQVREEEKKNPDLSAEKAAATSSTETREEKPPLISPASGSELPAPVELPVSGKHDLTLIVADIPNGFLLPDLISETQETEMPPEPEPAQPVVRETRGASVETFPAIATRRRFAISAENNSPKTSPLTSRPRLVAAENTNKVSVISVNSRPRKVTAMESARPRAVVPGATRRRRVSSP